MSLNEATWIVWVTFGIAGLFFLGLIATALWRIGDELLRLRQHREGRG